MLKTFVFILLSSVLSSVAHAKPTFNCQQLKGTFECSGQQAEIIEMNGDEFTILDGSEFPLTFKVNTRSQETSSETQHIVYSSECQISKIKIRKTVTDKTKAGTVYKEETVLSFNKKGDLQIRTESRSQNGIAVKGTLCSKVTLE